VQQVEQNGREIAMASLYENYAAAPVLQELAGGRPPVRGSGPLSSPFMVVGEAPDAEDEKQGRPFAGPAGQHLQRLFARAGIPWDLCYVTNALPWRPPGGRTPFMFQVQASAARLWQETAIVDPLIVAAAGAVAWRGLTREAMGPFETARFHWRDLNGRRLLALPDPADLLRMGEEERARWNNATVDALMQEASA
jgi:DNA polymerase